jgi:hypothetical protein
MKKLIVLIAVILISFNIDAQLRELECGDLTDTIIDRVNDNDSYLEGLITPNTTFRTTPSTVIDAGTGLEWSGNTLNATGAGSGDLVAADSGDTYQTPHAIDSLLESKIDTANTRLIVNVAMRDSLTFLSDSNTYNTNGYITRFWAEVNLGGGSSFDSVHVYAYIDSLNSIRVTREDSIILAHTEDVDAIWEFLGGRPPLFISWEVGIYNDSILLGIADANFHSDSTPPVSSFDLTEDGTVFGINTVRVNYDSVFLPLDSTISSNTDLLLSYTKGDTVLQDSSNRETPSFVNKTVTNNVTGPSFHSDDFNSYLNGTALAGQGDWVQGTGVMTCNGSAIYPNSTGDIFIYHNQTSGINQFSQINTTGVSSRGMGVGVRMSTDGQNGYFYINENGNTICYKIVSGVETQLGINSGSGNEFTTRIEVSGNTISCYIGGVLDTGLTGGTGQFTDSDLSSGYTGVAGNNDSSIKTGDDWEGGNL